MVSLNISSWDTIFYERLMDSSLIKITDCTLHRVSIVLLIGSFFLAVMNHQRLLKKRYSRREIFRLPLVDFLMFYGLEIYHR